MSLKHIIDYAKKHSVSYIFKSSCSRIGCLNKYQDAGFAKTEKLLPKNY